MPNDLRTLAFALVLGPVLRSTCRLGDKLAGGRCRVVVDAELGADPVAVGVVDLIEDPQGLGPGPAGR